MNVRIVETGTSNVAKGLAAWAGQPVSEIRPVGTRLPIMATTAGATAISVVLFHVYVDVGLSVFELTVHALMVAACVMAVWWGIEFLSRYIEIRRGSEYVRADVYWLLAIAALVVIFVSVRYFHEAFAYTSAIMAKHQANGYGGSVFLVLPFALLPVWVIFQAGRLHMLQRRMHEPSRRDGGSVKRTGRSYASLNVRVDGEDVALNANEIIYIKSEQNYCRFFILNRTTRQGRTYMVRMTLKQALTELDSPAFVRTHRSYVINIDYAKQQAGGRTRRCVHLYPDSRIPISRTRVADTFQAIKERRLG